MPTYLHKSWPRALAHIDGDAFFASVEQAVKPHLKGKPVVTGKERNIVAAASYEAKALGIRRGVTLWDAKKMCPELVVLPTDYETVSIFSKRMYEIMRRYTPTVEEYSVDEGFIDLSGLRRVHQGSYRFIAEKIQRDIHEELAITVSVGLSVSKVLCKVASGRDKPAGFEVISARDIEAALHDYPIGEVWNIGSNTAALLVNHGVKTAGELAARDREFVEGILSRPGVEVWQELRGESVWPVCTGVKSSYQSIGKSKTFTPPSTDKEMVLAQLMKNVEGACMKARRYEQAAKKVVIYLKRSDHSTSGVEATLVRPSAYPLELVEVISDLFNKLFREGTSYRATGVILRDLKEARPAQASLFEEPMRVLKLRRLYEAIDQLKEKYGKYAVQQGVTLASQNTQHLTTRGDVPERKLNLLPGETARRRLPLPMLQIKITA